MSEIKVNQVSPRTGVDVKIKSDTVTFENVAGTTSTSIAIESIVPVGCIQMYAGAVAPSGWMFCLGQSNLSTTTYAKLFAVIGYTYQVTQSGATFSVPDFQGISPVGVGSANTKLTDKDGSTGTALSATLGTYNKHLMQGHYHSSSLSTCSNTGSTTATLKRDSGGGADTLALSIQAPSTDGTNGTPQVGTYTRGPSLGINFIIKY